MKKAFAVLILLGLGILGWQIYEKASASREGAGRYRRNVTVAVETAPIRKSTIREIGLFTGSLRPLSAFFVAPKIAGRLEKILVHIGDTGRTDNLVSVCREADALVIESTYLKEETDMAREFAHLTADAAANLAADAGVENLILTHISRRYRERDVIAEARAVFPNAVVARDFDHFQVKRGEFAKLDKREG